jgi:hypothetical protein
MTRRGLLKAGGSALLGAWVTTGASGAERSPTPESLPRPEPPVLPARGIVGYVFNARSQDVTLFDPVTRTVFGTEPLGAVVRWLSNEQRFWDGRHLWTYDFPEDDVQAIAIDPLAVRVARRLPTGGAGPAHSLMLTPDRRSAWVNVAGGDFLAVFDIDSGELVAEVKTGKFP